MFQSLIGFKINWNIDAVRRDNNQQVFQSLIGFKINWNAATLKSIAEQWEIVSIPNRV